VPGALETDANLVYAISIPDGAVEPVSADARDFVGALHRMLDSPDDHTSSMAAGALDYLRHELGVKD
jgi:hypothetical protein